MVKHTLVASESFPTISPLEKCTLVKIHGNENTEERYALKFSGKFAETVSEVLDILKTHFYRFLRTT